MTKLIWMSDLHFTADGDVLGHDPQVRLQAAVDHINSHHADADICIISGDMVNRGTAEDYAGVRTLLDGLCVPYLPMVGNHDDRALFRAALPVPNDAMAEFIQYTRPTPEGLIVCLDTLKPGADSGAFCDARMAWLHDVLAAAKDRPVYLFMHHPPMALGLPMQDTDMLEEAQTFVQMVSRFNCVRFLFIGHVHRPITGTVAGIPFATMRSVLYQAPPPRPDWTWQTFQPAQEAPQLGIIHLADGAVQLHYEQFCDLGVGAI